MQEKLKVAVEFLRGAVEAYPLSTVAAAFALGVLFF